LRFLEETIWIEMHAGTLVALSSVSSRRPSGRLEMPDQKQQRDHGQGQPRNAPEAIHEGQQTHLTLQLLVEVSMCGGYGVRT